MGCLNSKSDEERGCKRDTSKGLGKLDEGKNTNEILDPRIPLTARQRFSITKSWKGITRALEPTGVNMFVKLFQEDANLLAIFVRFQSLKTPEAQRTDEELAKHATLVMETLDESISSLDKPDYFIEYLHDVGKRHRKIEGFKKEYFWKIEKPFLEAVKETLEDRYTENIESIYKITIKLILQTLVDGYEKGADAS